MGFLIRMLLEWWRTKVITAYISFPAEAKWINFNIIYFFSVFRAFIRCFCDKLKYSELFNLFQRFLLMAVLHLHKSVPPLQFTPTHCHSTSGPNPDRWQPILTWPVLLLCQTLWDLFVWGLSWSWTQMFRVLSHLVITFALWHDAPSCRLWNSTHREEWIKIQTPDISIMD